jgi:hypothetical protein
MKLRFISPHDQQPGLIASMLKQSYADVVESDPLHWGPKVPKWEQFDREVFEHPDTVGACVFLSWSGDQLVGFGSYDPRQKPEFGIVGLNCVLPEFCGRGSGNSRFKKSSDGLRPKESRGQRSRLMIIRPLFPRNACTAAADSKRLAAARGTVTHPRM